MNFSQQVFEFLQQQQVPCSPLPALKNQHFQLLQLSPSLFLHLISYRDMISLAGQPQLLANCSDTFEQQNKRIIHLSQDVWEQQNTLVKARLLALLGKRKRLHARQTQVIRIDKKQADDFLNQNHLQQTATAYYKYALQYKNEIVAVATFSKSRTMHDEAVPYRSYELVRFASKAGVTVTGGLSKLLAHFITQHHPAHLMTYADRDWSSGDSYRKLHFTFAAYTQPQLFYLHPGQKIRYYSHKLPAPFASEKELLKAGYLKIYNAGNSKWIWRKKPTT